MLRRRMEKTRRTPAMVERELKRRKKRNVKIENMENEGKTV